MNEAASLVGLHPNTVRAHLDVLVRSGDVTRETDSRASRGRPRELYRASEPPPSLRNYALLAELLAAGLAERADAPEEAERAGREWTERNSAHPDERKPAHSEAGRSEPHPAPGRERLAPVLGLLTEVGFAPQMTADGSRIMLRHCPFLEVARAHPEVVCEAHRGLLQEALDRVAPGVRARLVPFAEPGLCIAELDR